MESLVAAIGVERSAATASRQTVLAPRGIGHLRARVAPRALALAHEQVQARLLTGSQLFGVARQEPVVWRRIRNQRALVRLDRLPKDAGELRCGIARQRRAERRVDHCLVAGCEADVAVGLDCQARLTAVGEEMQGMIRQRAQPPARRAR